jgi:elongation factor Tu
VLRSVCTDFEAFYQPLDRAEAGQNLGLLLRGIELQFFFRTTNVTGEIELEADGVMVMPGDNAKVTVVLDKKVAIAAGTHFAMREGGRTVGSGVVLEIDNAK